MYFFLNITANALEFDAITAAVNAGWNGSSVLRIVINSGVYVYSDNRNKGGLIIPTHPGIVEIENSGYIIGGRHCFGGDDLSVPVRP
jgi:hypothetical protein